MSEQWYSESELRSQHERLMRIVCNRNDTITRLHESLSQKASEIETLNKSLSDRAINSDKQIAEIRTLRRTLGVKEAETESLRASLAESSKKAALSDLRNAELEGKVKRAEGSSNYWFQECEGLKKAQPRQHFTPAKLVGSFLQSLGEYLESEEHKESQKKLQDYGREFGK